MSHEMSETIRAAILPTIAKKTGVAVSVIIEFVYGADMHLTSASRIAAYLDLELKPSAKRKRGGMQSAKVTPLRKDSIVKKSRTMEPRAELVEDQATRAYFRRSGDSAQMPNRKATKVFEQDGKHYIRLSSANGPLATYRITPGTAGGLETFLCHRETRRSNSMSDTIAATESFQMAESCTGCRFDGASGK